MNQKPQGCPECGGVLILEDNSLKIWIYECIGCKSLHEAGKPIYTYQPRHRIEIVSPIK